MPLKSYVNAIFTKLIEESGFNPEDYLISEKADLSLMHNKLHNSDEIIKQLILLCNKSGVVFQQQQFNERELMAYLMSAPHPVLVFDRNQSNEIVAVVIKKTDNKNNYTFFHFLADTPDAANTNSISRITELNLEKNSDGTVSCITLFPIEAQTDHKEDHVEINSFKGRFKIVSKFLALLSEERKEIVYIWLYALLSGIITLSLPLGIQSLITFVSSGQAVTSVYILILFVILGIFGSGFITIMQLQLVEYIRQRMFVKNTLQYAYVIPKIQLESILKYNPPELINRFFDVVSVQKGVSTLLIDFSSASLQILFGIILLTLYHPIFVVIGVFLLLMLIILIMSTGPKGLETSINESTYKYKIANWLEEMARALSTFKLAGNTTFAQDKTESLLNKYLHWRNKHFSVLVTQYYSFVFFKTAITATLLLLGVYLIISQLITLGQFIAAEIIIILIMNSIEKIIIKLDTVYDVLTSTEKLTKVKQLPTDNYSGIEFPMAMAQDGIEIDITNLSYQYADSKSFVLKDVNLKIRPGERICICGDNGSGKTTLVNIMLGIYVHYKGTILYNGMSLRSINRLSLFDYLGDYISQQGIFDGTLMENILIGRKNISVTDLQWAIDTVGLSEWINQLPDGFDTQIVGGAIRLSSGTEKRIVLARNMVDKPRVLVLDDFLMGVSRGDKVRIIKTLTDPRHPWSVIMISNDPIIMQYCNRILLLEEGTITADSDFKTMEETNKNFRELIYNI
jgi:ABC-type bacteriocin/lantibiotic exporter with double-glycine peptidase domain